ncbi:glutathione S-transferase family protein [Nannocystaceae bacterium ST9]
MSTTLPTLWGLSVSPWTERARWALDHHGVRYRYREHTPMLGEPGLRWRARRRESGRATVPLWIDDRRVLADSVAIARLADRSSSNHSLFPAEHDAAIQAGADEADRVMNSMRALVVAALLNDPEAQVESLPAQIPRGLRVALRGMAKTGTRFLGRKYAADLDHLDACEQAGREYLASLRARLGGRDHLFDDRLSFADIVAAVVINGFAGGDPIRLRDQPALQRVWTRPALAEEFADLVGWRDRLYQQRPRPAR